MPRKPGGWKLRAPRDACGSYTVRFTWNGSERELSTGTGDVQRAPIEAARIYAREVQRPEKPKPATPSRAVGEFEGAVSRWLATLIPTHDAGTVACYSDYSEKHWQRFFVGLHDLTDARCAEYMRARLLVVRADTVKKELSALRGFIRWASSADVGLIGACEVPSVPERSTGVPYKQRRRSAAIPISSAEVRKIIRALPEWSTSKKVDPFPIRARFEVQYETGLRPELMDLLSVPEHYRKKATHLRIVLDIDKMRDARRIPLSAAARAALDRICPDKGEIFGHHDYRPALRAAASKALPEDRAELFCGAHLRSARITHWIDDGAPLTAIMRLVGIKRLETMGRYVRAADKAAEELVAPKKRRRRR